MPVLDLLVEKMDVIGLPKDGNLSLAPPLPDLSRVLLRRLYCWLRVPPIPGARKAIFDTGAPLTVFPYQVWKNDFGWQAGQHFDELSVAGIGTTLTGQVLNYRYSCRLARLRVPVELAGSNLKSDRLRLDSLICQLADPSGPQMLILGLWGGVFTGRQLAVEQQPNSDDLQARLSF
jgi:hypothetical protein